MLPASFLRLANIGRWDDVFRCITGSCYDVNDTFESSVTLLHVAAACNDVAAGQRLLEMGADAHARDIDGWSAIHVAARLGFTDFCAALPSTCIAQPTERGRTVLQLACQMNQAETTKKQVERCRLICWLLEQPECDPDAEAYTLWRANVRDGYIAEDNVVCVEAAFEWARGGRRRWTAPRAAWLSACCCV